MSDQTLPDATLPPADLRWFKLVRPQPIGDELSTDLWEPRPGAPVEASGTIEGVLRHGAHGEPPEVAVTPGMVAQLLGGRTPPRHGDERRWLADLWGRLGRRQGRTLRRRARRSRH